MSETPETAAPAEEKKERGPKGEPRNPNLSRKTLKKLGREKRRARLQNDRAFAEAYFGGKSKRSDAAKVAFRKRHGAKQTAGA